MIYDPNNWYWIVAGSTTHVYSSASQSYVSVSDSTYLAWVASGGEATPIASEALLYEVLNPETPSAIERDAATGSIDPTDGGPWTFTATSGKFLPIGGTLYLRPFADPSIAVIGEVKAYSGTDLTVSLRATNATVSQTYDLWSISLLDAPPAKLPYTSISGFAVTINSGDSRYFDIAAGAVRSWDDTTDLILDTGLTKRANETFVAGTDGGAQVRVLLAGTVSSTGSAVTGSGTAFLTDFAASSLNGLPSIARQISTGDGVGGNVQSVTNDTSLTTNTFGDLGASADTYYRGGWPGSSNQGHFGIVVARKDSDGSVDIVLSAVTPTGAPDLPSGYTKYRVIGYLVVRSNAIIRIVQTLKEVQYSSLSAVEAYALIGNNTSASRYPEGIVIPSLTEKTTLVSADLFLIADSAASNAFKKVQFGNLEPNDSVTNAKLANMAAYTLKGRNAGSTGDPSDIDISALTEKTALVDADLFIVQDSAASNAFKKAKRTSFGFREKLTANRTYYVRTDGSDSNTGLVNSSGGAFLTIQKAWDVIVTLDLGGFTATIQLGDGTYTSGLFATVPPLGGNVTINGNSSTPANVIISTSGAAIHVFTRAQVTVTNLEVRSSASWGLRATGGGARIITSTGMRFGACTAAGHMVSENGAEITLSANYTIAGAAAFHHNADASGIITSGGSITVTNSGTNAFTYFAYAAVSGIIITAFNTYTGGTITGQRYLAASNGIINTFGTGGANYFPGNVAGATATGGQYI